MTKAVIIDDNTLAIASLRADVEDNCTNVEVVGVAEGVIEAAKLLREVQADLLFLDIHMNNGTGFDLLDILEADKYSVIFTTASPDFALKAFEYAAVDYLLKPIDPKRLVEAVAKLSTKKALNKTQVQLLKNSQNPEKIALSTAEEIRMINLSDIIRLESSNNYTTFFLENKEKIMVSKTMKDYEFLEGSGFYRVHQSHIVNLSKVKAYIKSEGGYILLRDGSHIPVSVRKKPEVMKVLQMD